MLDSSEMTDKTIVTKNEPSPRRPVDVLFQARLTVTPPNKGVRRRPRRFVEPMKRIGERIGEKVLWELSKHAWEKVGDLLSELFRQRAAPLTGAGLALRAPLVPVTACIGVAHRSTARSTG